MAVAFGDGADFSGMTTDDPPRDHRRPAPDVRRGRRGRHRGGRRDRGRDGGDQPAGEPARARARPPVPLRRARHRARDPAVRRPGRGPVLT